MCLLWSDAVNTDGRRGPLEGAFFGDKDLTTFGCSVSLDRRNGMLLTSATCKSAVKKGS